MLVVLSVIVYYCSGCVLVVVVVVVVGVAAAMMSRRVRQQAFKLDLPLLLPLAALPRDTQLCSNARSTLGLPSLPVHYTSEAGDTVRPVSGAHSVSGSSHLKLLQQQQLPSCPNNSR